MPITLRDSLEPLVLRDSAKYAPGQAQGATYLEAQDTNPLTRGWNATGEGLVASQLLAEANAAERKGDIGLSQALQRRAQDHMQQAQTWAPTTQNFDEINSLGSGAEWLAGSVGGGLRSMIAPVAGGALGSLAGGAVGMLTRNPGLGARAAQVLAPAGAFVPGYDMAYNETVGQAMMGPEVRARSTAQDIHNTGQVAGAVSGALDAIVPAGMAKIAVGGMGKRLAGRTIAKGMVDEGVTEGAQNLVGQTAQNQLRGDDLTNYDYRSAFNDAMAGAVAGGAISAGGVGVGKLRDKIAAGGEAVADTARDPVGRVIEAMKARAEKQGREQAQQEIAAGNTPLEKMFQQSAEQAASERFFDPAPKDATDEEVSASARASADQWADKILSSQPRTFGPREGKLREAAAQYKSDGDWLKFRAVLKENNLRTTQDEMAASFDAGEKASEMFYRREIPKVDEELVPPPPNLMNEARRKLAYKLVGLDDKTLKSKLASIGLTFDQAKRMQAEAAAWSSAVEAKRKELAQQMTPEGKELDALSKAWLANEGKRFGEYFDGSDEANGLGAKLFAWIKSDFGKKLTENGEIFIPRAFIEALGDRAPGVVESAVTAARKEGWDIRDAGDAVKAIRDYVSSNEGDFGFLNSAIRYSQQNNWTPKMVRQFAKELRQKNGQLNKDDYRWFKTQVGDIVGVLEHFQKPSKYYKAEKNMGLKSDAGLTQAARDQDEKVGVTENDGDWSSGVSEVELDSGRKIKFVGMDKDGYPFDTSKEDQLSALRTKVGAFANDPAVFAKEIGIWQQAKRAAKGDKSLLSEYEDNLIREHGNDLSDGNFQGDLNPVDLTAAERNSILHQINKRFRTIEVEGVVPDKDPHKIPKEEVQSFRVDSVTNNRRSPEKETAKNGFIFLERNIGGNISYFPTTTTRLLQHIRGNRRLGKEGAANIELDVKVEGKDRGAAGALTHLEQAIADLISSDKTFTGRIGYKMRGDSKQPIMIEANGRLPGILALGNGVSTAADAYRGRVYEFMRKGAVEFEKDRGLKEIATETNVDFTTVRHFTTIDPETGNVIGSERDALFVAQALRGTHTDVIGPEKRNGEWGVAYNTREEKRSTAHLSETDEMNEGSSEKFKRTVREFQEETGISLEVDIASGFKAMKPKVLANARVAWRIANEKQRRQLKKLIEEGKYFSANKLADTIRFSREVLKNDNLPQDGHNQVSGDARGGDQGRRTGAGKDEAVPGADPVVQSLDRPRAGANPQDRETDSNRDAGGRNSNQEIATNEGDAKRQADEKNLVKQDAWVMRVASLPRKDLKAFVNALPKEKLKRAFDVLESFFPVDNTNQFWQRNDLDNYTDAKSDTVFEAQELIRDRLSEDGVAQNLVDVAKPPAFAREKEQAKLDGADYVFAPSGVDGSFASRLAEAAKVAGKLIDPNGTENIRDKVVYVSVPGAGRGFAGMDAFLADVRKLLDRGAVLRTDTKDRASTPHNAAGEGKLRQMLAFGNYVLTEGKLFDSWQKNLPRVKASEQDAKDSYSWARFPEVRGTNYEVSSAGDKRFSALNATLKDGRTIEEAYQLDVKGYRVKGDQWRLGKGKPPLKKMSKAELYGEYKSLWSQWAKENPSLMRELAKKAEGKVLTDQFASTDISQARVLSELLNEQKFSEQAEDGEAKASEQAPSNQTIDPKQALEDLARMLGKDYDAKVVKNLGGKAGTWTKSGIKLAASAPNGTQYHEALHEMFSQMREHGADNVRELIERVASSPLIMRKLEQLLEGHPKAIKQLKTPEEAAAFLFQFWNMGLINVGPETKSLFQTVKDWVANVAKDLYAAVNAGAREKRAGEKAAKMDQAEVRRLFEGLAAGGVANPDTRAAVYDALRKNAEAHQKAIDELGQRAEKFWRGMGKYVVTSETMLNLYSKHPELKNLIADRFHQMAGKSMKNQARDASLTARGGYIEAVHGETQSRLTKFERFLMDAKFDQKDMELAAKHLEANTQSSDKKIQSLIDFIHDYYGEMYDYATQSDVRRLDPNHPDRWVPLQKRKNYFTQSWSIEELSKDHDGFVSTLLDKHRKELEGMAKQANAELVAWNKNPDVKVQSPTAKKEVERAIAEFEQSGQIVGKLGINPVTPEMIAETIYTRLLNSTGLVDIQESEWSLGITPAAAAVNRRELDWLDKEAFSKYKSKDLVEIVTSYTRTMVKRAEYQKRFGYSGEVIAEAMDTAFLREMGGDKLVDDASTALLSAISSWKKAYAEFKAENPDATFPEPYPTLRMVGADLHRSKVGEDKANADMVAAEETLRPAINAVRAMEGTLGNEIGQGMRSFNSWVNTYQNVRLLPLALFTNFSDVIGVTVQGGTLGDAWDAFTAGIREVRNTWVSEKGEDKRTMRAEEWGVSDAGALLDTLGQNYSSVYMNEKARAVNNKFFRIIGMEGWNRGVRITASAVGERVIMNWVSNGVDAKKPGEQARFERLYGEGFDPKSIKLDKGGNLDTSDAANRAAIQRFVQDAVMSSNPAVRATWMSDPRMATFAHLKNFAYAFHSVMLKGILAQVAQGNLRPALVAGLGYASISIAAGAIKEMLIPGDEPFWMQGGLDGYLEYGYGQANLGGVPQLWLDGATQLDPAKLAGPFWDQIQNTLSAPLPGLKLNLSPMDGETDIISDRKLAVELAKALPAGNLAGRAMDSLIGE